MAAIATAGPVNVVPRSDSHLGLRAFIPILEMYGRVRKEGISSDNEVCYAHVLFTEMRVLQTGQRGLSFGEMCSEATDFPAPYGAMDALRAATVGGALNAALSDRIGTLTAGEKADLVAVSLEQVNTCISGSAVGTVVSFAGIGNVDTVLINGAVVRWGGKLIGVD